MQAALVDANVLIATVSERDADHDRAFAILNRADERTLPTLQVTNHVLAETFNYVAERGHRSAAVDLYERLAESPGFELVRVTHEDERNAIERYRTSDQLSFVDASIGSYAARSGVDYCYSFDDDLDGLDDVSRLNRPVDPYSPE